MAANYKLQPTELNSRRTSARTFEEVYLRHHRSVYRLRMTQNGAEAKDLTQEVFAHLFRKIGNS